MLQTIRSNALKALIPPPRIRLSEWIESNVILPEGVSAQSGPVELWPFQVEIADAIGDAEIERVTIVKPVRVGFTTLLTSAIASFVANEPSPILCLLPTEADCRDYMVSDVEPIFDATKAVDRVLSDDPNDRNTILSRRFPGGSLKVVAAKAPRNLRRHTARVLFIDEADGMEATAEGSPIMLAERRTMSFPDRKIVLGSTPVHEDTSHVLRHYALSDQRVFEVPCPECGVFNEIQWSGIVWDEGRPETARWKCPDCSEEIGEWHKTDMVTAGEWRRTAPEVVGHAGFRLNALVSLHANASWSKLAQEFVAAKSDPTMLQTFVNTILGQGWRGAGDELDDEELAGRAEEWGLEQVPEDVLALTAGADVQHDRIEVTFVGWSEGGNAYALGHRVVWGHWEDNATWSELDAVLKTTWPHVLGGRIGLDAVCVDAGDGTTMKTVMKFCGARSSRKVLAIKGAPGSRPLIERSASKPQNGARLWIVGVDTAKTQIFNRLGRGGTIRISADLPRVWCEQIASERSVVRYRRGQPVRLFERIPGRRAEALDCMVYAFAARQVINVNWTDRETAMKGEIVAKSPPPKKVAKSDWFGNTKDWL